MMRDGACGEVTGADFFRSSDYAPYGGGTAMPPPFRNGSYPFQDLGVHGLYLLEAFLGPIRHADIRYYASGIGDPNLVFDEWRATARMRPGHRPDVPFLERAAHPKRSDRPWHARGDARGLLPANPDRCARPIPGPKAVQRILGAGIEFAGHAGEGGGEYRAVRHRAPGSFTRNSRFGGEVPRGLAQRRAAAGSRRGGPARRSRCSKTCRAAPMPISATTWRKPNPSRSLASWSPAPTACWGGRWSAGCANSESPAPAGAKAARDSARRQDPVGLWRSGRSGGSGPRGGGHRSGLSRRRGDAAAAWPSSPAARSGARAISWMPASGTAFANWCTSVR